MSIPKFPMFRSDQNYRLCKISVHTHKYNVNNYSIVWIPFHFSTYNPILLCVHVALPPSIMCILKFGEICKT